MKKKYVLVSPLHFEIEKRNMSLSVCPFSTGLFLDQTLTLTINFSLESSKLFNLSSRVEEKRQVKDEKTFSREGV